VVPFSEHVNVGVSRRSASWLQVPADYVKVTDNAGYWQKQTKTTCTGKQNYACSNDGRPATCTRNTGCTTVSNGPDKWVPPSQTKQTYTFRGCVGSPAYPKNVEDKDPLRRYPGPVTPNTSAVRCNSEITLLTVDKKPVLDAITALAAAGATYIPSGLAWGYNMLSKAEPLTDAAAYDPSGDNRMPRKVLVLMTDGANTTAMTPTPAAYGGYGYIHNKAISGNATLQKQTDGYTLELCDNIKKSGIEVFTVAFLLDDANARGIVEKCATDKEHFYDASDAAKLQAAFSDIADSLRNLYIAQ